MFNNRCYRCFGEIKVRYNVDNDVMNSIVPGVFRNKICISCYDHYAQKAGVEWKTGPISFRPAGGGVRLDHGYTG